MKFSTICIIIFVIACLIILWYFCVNYFSPDISKINNKFLKDIFEIKDNLKTGDLIFLSGPTFGEKAIKLYTNSYFSHVGLIIKENNKLFIFESDLGQGYRKGVRMIPLEEKLQKYSGHNIGAIRYIKNELNLDKVLSIIKDIIHYDFDNNMLSWLLSKSHNIIYNMVKPSDKAFCSEIITYVFQKMNIISDLDVRTTYYSPKNYLEEFNKIYNNKIYFKWNATGNS